MRKEWNMRHAILWGAAVGTLYWGTEGATLFFRAALSLDLFEFEAREITGSVVIGAVLFAMFCRLHNLILRAED
jgi:hypothetical protein